ncbi:ATP-dependent DNA helicase [Trichonephila clavipes]|nr:ATP-dependent DNA helicase [Trichonephila clavipes]
MMVRRNNFNSLLRCRLLFHQFLVDMYVKVGRERLRFISLNQTKLRAENYIHLQDAIINDADFDPNSLGQMVILPSSFVNSARYLHEYTQDAFTYVRNYGRPDLFITMTCNPAWPEITRELIPGQNSTDRHDLTARVFKVKVKKLVALLTKDTKTNDKGYPLYRRRAPEDGGHTLAQKTQGGIQEILVDNSWIVPYSPLLSKIFNCHINVEFCNTVKAIKYICKYINKGSDQAIFNIRQPGNVNIDPRDEVQTFRAGRYVSSNEAAWRILGLPLHERHPTVIHLAVHLPNGERIYFTENNIRERMATPPKTTLTAFFQLCQNNAFSKTLLYVDVPRCYTWNVSLKEWKRRVQGTHVNDWPGVKAGDALGRIYTVHVSNFECYCLRMLLNVIQGPTNFLDLKTVDGQEFQTFHQVCEKLELLEDDNHWDAAMEEAVLCRSPSQIRELFAILICTCGLYNPLQVWDKYKVALSEDILHIFKKMDQVNNDLCLNEALIHIEDKIIRISGKKLSDFSMPTPQRRGELSTDLIKELSYNIALLDTQVSETEPRLLPEQKDIYNKILQRVELAKIRKDRNVALVVASSGIAVTLLSGEQTAHSVFKLPLNLANEDPPTCNFSKNSALGALLQQCKLIVWYECTMSHKRAIEALDRCLQDIQNNRKLMGGVVVLLAEDFRQSLPVIERGTAADEINAYLKASYLWTKVEKLYLTH